MFIEAGLAVGGAAILWQRRRRTRAPEDPLINIIGPPIPTCQLLFEAGWDTSGSRVEADLADMPHLIVAGMTGSGKSTFVNVMLVELMTAYSPDQLKLVLIDPKRVEMMPFAASKHVLSFSYEVDESIARLKTLIVEMERRYEVLAMSGAKKVEQVLGMPRVVVVVEELANMMLSGRRKEVEAVIVKLASQGRAAGIHLVLITQRPSVDVVTGILKANVPARACLATVTATDSRVILDQSGAEGLAGRGDMLLMLPGSRALERLQVRLITDVEVAYATHKW